MKTFYLNCAIFLVLTGFSFPLMAQWTNQTNVNTLVSTASSSDCKAIAASEGKTWVVYWKELGAPSYYEMRAQLLGPNGDTLFGPQGIVVNNTVAMSSYTNTWSVTSDINGNLFVGLNGSGSGTQVYAHKISMSGAQLWGTQGLMLGSGYDVKILPLQSGAAIVSWLPTNQGVFQKINANGTVAWTNPVQVQPGISGHNCSVGEMVELAGGDFVALIHDRAGPSPSSSFYAQRYTTSGTQVWASPLSIATSSGAFNKRYDVVADGDTVYLGYTGAVGSIFYSYLQRINPAGSIPWGSNGVRFSTQSTYYERDTRMVYQPGSPYIWTICEFTPTSQGTMGEYVQKFDKATGARMLGNIAPSVFAVSSNDNSHKGELRLYNDQPLFVYSNGTNNGGLPITLRATYLNSGGAFAWPYQYVDMASYSSTYKSRVSFTRPDFNGNSVCVWVEDRGSGSRIYAQNIVPCQPPVAGFSSSIAAMSAAFTSTSGSATTISWNFGDGTTGTGLNPAHTYIDTGTFLVCQKVQNACGVDSICSPVHIVCDLAVAAFSLSYNGLSVSFQNNSLFADSVRWDFGDGSGDTSYSPSHTYAGNGLYQVCLIVFNECNTDTICQPVSLSVGLSPIGSFSFSLYPNPGTGNFHIRSSYNITGNLDYEVVSLTGQVMIRGVAVFGEGQTAVRIEGLTKGLYYLRILHDGEYSVLPLLLSSE